MTLPELGGRSAKERAHAAEAIAGEDAASFGLNVLCYLPSVAFEHTFALRGGPEAEP